MKGVIVIAVLGSWIAGFGAEEETAAAVPPPVLPAPLATLDVANTADGTYPGGATPVQGTWYVEKSAAKLKLKTEPLVTGWLEFGPEIREKGATINALARGPGEGRLKSRIGAGLYGKNGFEIRIDPGKGRIELVRRGIVLESVEQETDPETLYEMELSVLEEEGNWRVTGRVWEYETARPEAPLLTHLADAAKLLFPLAGRPFIVATPFSGEPVQYVVARVYSGDPFAPVEEPAAVEED